MSILKFSGVLLFVLAGIARAEIPITVLHNFGSSPTDGAEPLSHVIAAGSVLYGVAGDGGTTTGGTIYQIGMDGSNYTSLYNFSLSAGTFSQASLMLSSSTLFGTTWTGGTLAAQYGTIFSVNTDGTNYFTMHNFNGTSDSRSPHSALTKVGPMLFGTSSGMSDFGPGVDGTLYRINANGSGFQVLHTFSDGATDGYRPYSDLTLVGSTLFGTTISGGAANGNGRGTVFKINVDGTGFAILHSFSGADGAGLDGSLSVIGSTLYGTTSGGGDGNAGTIFSIGMDGSGFTTLHSFDGDGVRPLSGLTAIGSVLYGTTSGGLNSTGNIFSINADGNGFVVLHTFQGPPSEGQRPNANLIAVGNTLYGTTDSGGPYAGGTLFAITVPEPMSFTLAVTCLAILILTYWQPHLRGS
jgi:uncharacterized repeat protein (TIGR03803 family)